jgi:hypothetical protein
MTPQPVKTSWFDSLAKRVASSSASDRTPSVTTVSRSEPVAALRSTGVQTFSRRKGLLAFAAFTSSGVLRFLLDSSAANASSCAAQYESCFNTANRETFWPTQFASAKCIIAGVGAARAATWLGFAAFGACSADFLYKGNAPFSKCQDAYNNCVQQQQQTTPFTTPSTTPSSGSQSTCEPGYTACYLTGVTICLPPTAICCPPTTGSNAQYCSAGELCCPGSSQCALTLALCP